MPQIRGGQPVPRPANLATPCFKCPKQSDREPKPTPETAFEIEPRHVRAYQHYKRCRAVGRFPEDELTEWLAGFLAQSQEMAEREWRKRDLETVMYEVGRILRK